MLDETTSLVDGLVIRKGATIYRAINHPLRQQILAFIHKKGETIVTEVYRALSMEQSVASQHLAILRHAKIVKTRREGKHVFYSANYERIKDIHAFSDQLLRNPE